VDHFNIGMAVNAFVLLHRVGMLLPRFALTDVKALSTTMEPDVSLVLIVSTGMHKVGHAETIAPHLVKFTPRTMDVNFALHLKAEMVFSVFASHTKDGMERCVRIFAQKIKIIHQVVVSVVSHMNTSITVL
jgi:hypothetical protein